MKQVFHNLSKKKSFSFRILFLTVAVIVLTIGRVTAQNELDVIRNNWLQYSDAPNSLYHFLTGKAFESLRSREGKIAQIKSTEQLLKRQEEVRQTIWKILGPFDKKTPLNAKVTGTIKKNGYRVENVIFESQPGFYVTASLFIKKMLKYLRLQYYFAADTAAALTGCPLTRCLC